MAKLDETLYDAVVIGGGPAGLTAAIYLARACYRVVVIEKEKFGGQITITSEVVNYPGSGPVSGTELTERMRQQAENFGAEFMLAEVKSIDMDGDIKKIQTNRGELRAFGVLLAAGAHPRLAGFRNEMEFRGHGVAYCATCDGEFFTGKEVFVIGGGFAAAEESVFLTRYASHVTILIRGDDFKCAKETADEARANPNITVVTNAVVDSVEGDTLLRSITYHDKVTGEQTTFRPENGDSFGVFVFTGYQPSTELVRGIAELDPQGYIITDRNQHTSKEGLYAAGDICVKELRQVVTATADGAIAATEMEKYLSAQSAKTGLVTVKPVKRSDLHKPMDAAPDPDRAAEQKSAASDGGLITEDMAAQLNVVFSRMENPLILDCHLDGQGISRELQDYMEALAAMTDLLTVRKAGTADDDPAELPYVRILRKDETPSGITFHGVPGGHEFTSFVLGLYNASGPGQSVPDDVRKRIDAVGQDVQLKIMVSLTCTMCPDLVTAAGRIATLNPRIRADIYDLNRFEKMREQYNVMSVPCFVINDSTPDFGKKDTEQLITLIEAQL